ncbi:MAG: xanthine dehydrogenase family protein molybdopterin-binding subunit [Anaerolineales bacterium]
MADQSTTIGKTEIRKDAWQKAAGKALYTADIPVENLNYGVVVRSQHHYARILEINKTAALKVPGVLQILTAEDIPGEKIFGPLIPDQPSLAQGVVRHLGEPICLVIAETRIAAQRAKEKINIKYQPLVPVFDPVLAVKSDAPQLHQGGNLVTELNVQDGDVEGGFKEADIVLEEVYYLPRISPGYMEPETSLAVWQEDNMVTVWVSSQHPFTDQGFIAAALDIPISSVRVKSAVIGGAFGGKEDSSLSILAALGAQSIKGALKIVNNRRESFLAHPKRHPAQIKYKLGAKQDGTFTALQVAAYLDTGAYSSYGPAVGMIFSETMTGSYRIPNVKVDTYVVYTNSPISGAMRGFGSPQSHFAVESMVDTMAEALGMDPLKLRDKNILHPGDKVFTGVTINETANSLPDCLENILEIRKRFQAVKPSPGKKAGVGFALGSQTMGLGANVPDDSTHRLEWAPDGRVLIHLGSPDLGQGLATAAEQITAESLGIPFDQVATLELDTLDSPNGNVTCASRMTYMVGNALLDASAKLIQELLEHSSRMLDVPAEKLTYKNGQIHKPDGSSIPAVEFVSRLAEESITLLSESTFSFPYPEETTPKHLPIGMPHVLYCFGAQIARVEIDPELGMIDVTHFAAIHDVGKVINRHGVEGQIEGGVATGLGYALYETMLQKDKGWVDSFTEYLLPTAVDLPPNYQSIILEIPEASGPFGAKGIGEISLVPTAPAVANAVYDAVGVRVTRLPITPERILGFAD